MVPKADSTQSTAPDLFFEKRAIRRGATIVAGVDEVGRGPLAGPVVVAGVHEFADPADGGGDLEKLAHRRA